MSLRLAALALSLMAAPAMAKSTSPATTAAIAGASPG